MKRLILIVSIVVLLLGFTAGAAFADSPVQAAAEKYFAGGTKNMKAADLYANLNDGDTSNDPFLLDIRAAADFANGHIKGATNIPGKELFTAENLAKLPKDKAIVGNCYTGQTCSQVVAALRMMGYEAYNLTYGIPSWGYNDKVGYPFTAAQSGNYKVSTDPAALDGTNEAPKPLGDTPQAAAMAYFPGGFKVTKAADLFANLNDGDTGNDPILLDLRAAEDYAAGHIPGAVNMDVKTMFTAANLAKLPADKQIVSYCYSGQTSSQATAALRMLGYDAYSLQFGMASWAIVDPKSTPVWDISKSGNYPLEVTAAAAAAAPAAAPAASAAPATMPTTGADLAGLARLIGLAAAGAAFAAAGLRARK